MDATNDYGVVKMNVDRNMHYAFTRAIAGHMFKNYDDLLKVDCDSGTKKSMTRARIWRSRGTQWPSV